jgi:hypothetical protein
MNDDEIRKRVQERLANRTLPRHLPAMGLWRRGNHHHRTSLRAAHSKTLARFATSGRRRSATTCLRARWRSLAAATRSGTKSGTSPSNGADNAREENYMQRAGGAYWLPRWFSSRPYDEAWELVREEWAFLPGEDAAVAAGAGGSGD